MSNQLEVNVNLINQKLQFSGCAKSNPEVIIDYSPPLGDGCGYTSLELLLLSLASCSASSIISLLRKMQKNISGINVIAKGERKETHPTALKNILLEFSIYSKNVELADVQKAIKLSEETYCPVWAMLKGNTNIDTEVKIIQEN